MRVSLFVFPRHTILATDILEILQLPALPAAPRDEAGPQQPPRKVTPMEDSTYIGNQTTVSPLISPSGQLVVSSSEGIFSLVSARPEDTSNTRSHLAAFVQSGSSLTQRFSIRSKNTSAGPVLQIYMGGEPDQGGVLVLSIDGGGNMIIAGSLTQNSPPSSL
ncbi:hypothetical protein ACNOYE_03450 [Nannocystaceae bacterium ST9]